MLLNNNYFIVIDKIRYTRINQINIPFGKNVLAKFFSLFSELQFRKKNRNSSTAKKLGIGKNMVLKNI